MRRLRWKPPTGCCSISILSTAACCKLDYGGQVRTAIFAVESPTQNLVLAAPNRLRQFVEYLQHGMRHIWLGFDHVLFLLSLLLPAVLVRNGMAWQPAAGLKPALWDVLKVVTAFTLAHSITLTLAALNVIALPSRLVESAIAVSVVLAALNNIYPVVSERRWVLAFVFGLIHGFGFASVLADLGLPRGTLLSALVAFNLGVEAGQITIVALLLPLAWWLRRSWVYRRLTLYGGSAVVAMLALAWLIERALRSEAHVVSAPTPVALPRLGARRASRGSALRAHRGRAGAGAASIPPKRPRRAGIATAARATRSATRKSDAGGCRRAALHRTRSRHRRSALCRLRAGRAGPVVEPGRTTA